MKAMTGVIIGMVTVLPVRAQLITFSFQGAAGSEAAWAPEAVAGGLSVNPFTRGTGLSSASGAGTFSASGWSTGTLDAQDYFAFSLTPESGWDMSLSQLSLDERRSATGIRAWSVRSSLDAFSSDLGYFEVPDDADTRVGQTTLLGLAFDHLESGVEFRVYGFGAESGSGTWRIDNVTLQGEISAVPEPAEYALVFGIGLMAYAIGGRLRGRQGTRAGGLATPRA
jgi:hypothetical protein